ncbi:hypothetical protein RB195_025387 [Necator americanus]|uniref:Reverse transcriptase domain-containing protein n=1 Tax=Necator americanus TaxID=51031 RepID=A0ABR1ES63_NECAM
MESLVTNIRLVTLNCRQLSSELQQAALSRLLRHLHAPFAVFQETRIRDRPLISDDNYTIYCGYADERKDASKKTLPVLTPGKKFAFASAEKISTYNSVCVARTTGDFSQASAKEMRRQLKGDRENECTLSVPELVHPQRLTYTTVSEERRSRRGVSLMRVTYNVLERIIVNRLIPHREETTRDEQAGFRPDRSTID